MTEETKEEKNMRGERSVLKTIQTVMCPHCNKDFYTSLRTIPSEIEWSLKKTDIERAKDRVRERILVSTLPDDEKKVALTWINQETTLFGPEEVEGIIKNILDVENMK